MPTLIPPSTDTSRDASVEVVADPRLGVAWMPAVPSGDDDDDDAPTPAKRTKYARTARATEPKYRHSPSEEEEEDDRKPAAKPRVNARPTYPIPRRSGRLQPVPPPAVEPPQVWKRKMVARKSVGPHGVAAWRQETKAIRRSRRIQAAVPPPSQNHPPSNRPKRKRKNNNSGPLTGDQGPVPMEPRPPGPPRFWANLEPRYLGPEFTREMYSGREVAPPPPPPPPPPPDDDDPPSRPQKPKRGRTRKVAKRKNKKDTKPNKKPYKQIKTPDFHRLLDTKDSSHLTEVQHDLY